MAVMESAFPMVSVAVAGASREVVLEAGWLSVAGCRLGSRGFFGELCAHHHGADVDIERGGGRLWSGALALGRSWGGGRSGCLCGLLSTGRRLRLLLKFEQVGFKGLQTALELAQPGGGFGRKLARGNALDDAGLVAGGFASRGLGG